MFQFTSHKTPWHHCRPSGVDILSSFDNIIMVISWIFVSYQLNNNTLSRESRFLGTTAKCFTNKYYFSKGGIQRPPGYRKAHSRVCMEGGWLKETWSQWELKRHRTIGTWMYYPWLKDLREWQSPWKTDKNLVLSILKGQFLGLDTTPITRLCLSKSIVVGTDIFNQCILLYYKIASIKSLFKT